VAGGKENTNWVKNRFFGMKVVGGGIVKGKLETMI
jgi:hypothetical protein